MTCTFVNESSLINLDMGHLARLTALKVPLIHDSFISKFLEDTSLDLLDHVFDPTSQGGNRRAVH